MLGVWEAGPFRVTVTEDRLRTTLHGEPYEYPNGSLTHIKDGVAELILDGGGEDMMVYGLLGVDDEEAYMAFTRAAHVFVTPGDQRSMESFMNLRKALQKRNKTGEQDAALKSQVSE